MALPPVVSLAAYTPLLIGDVVLTAKVFDVPGVYQLIPHALDVGNSPVIQGIVLVTTAFVVVANGWSTSRWPRLRTA